MRTIDECKSADLVAQHDPNFEELPERGQGLGWLAVAASSEGLDLVFAVAVALDHMHLVDLVADEGRED